MLRILVNPKSLSGNAFVTLADGVEVFSDVVEL